VEAEALGSPALAESDKKESDAADDADGDDDDPFGGRNPGCRCRLGPTM
jgi:hypothetical protein